MSSSSIHTPHYFQYDLQSKPYKQCSDEQHVMMIDEMRLAEFWFSGVTVLIF